MKLKRKKHRKVLVLNADFTPIALMDWRRALVLTLENQEVPGTGLEAIEYYKTHPILSAGHRKFPVPSVVRSPKYLKNRRQRVKFSRKNLFLRDNLTCMYCGNQYIKSTDLTYDHVIPRDIWKKNNYPGTPTTWTNIVTCCLKCNRYKRNRTPKQANMKLLKEPKEPSVHQYIINITPWTKIHSSWEPYLPVFYKNLLKKTKCLE